jgi:glycosyltransferase involved in cell wall biosynthesis
LTKEVCVILPALNEEDTIGMVIDEIPMEEIERRGYKVNVMVVNNGSTDRTEEIAREKGAQVICEPRRGKGMARRAGFEAMACDFVFILDSDYTYPAVHIPSMLEELEEGCDVVMGSRLKGRMAEGAMTLLNLVGNHLLALMANVLYGTRISDPCTGCWGLRAEVVKELKLEARGFDIEVNMLTEIARNGYRIAEVPIDYRRRGTRTKLNSLRDGFRIGKTLVKRRFRPR